MKTIKVFSPMFRAAEVSALGLLVALSGCASAPTRLTTLEADSSPALVAAAETNFEAPVPLHTVTPQLPFAMRRAGRGGDIQLKCLIDDRGVVREAEVLKSSDWELERPALQAVEQWTFTPARRYGVPVTRWVMIPMSFTVTD